MQKEQVYVVFDRKYKVKKGTNGIGTVDVYVYLSRKERKYISVGRCKRSEFKAFSQEKHVQAMVHRCEKVIAALTVLNMELNTENFTAYFDRDEKKASSSRSATPSNMYKGSDLNQDFIAYMQKFVDDEDLAEGTRKHKLTTIEALKEFGQIKTFADLTPAKILAFDKRLRDGTRSDPTVYNYHKNIHKVTRRMRMLDLIPYDPYDRIPPIKRGCCKERKPLTEEEIKKVREAKLTGKMEKVRDLFIFSAFTGLSYADAMEFNFKLHTDKVGNLYYIDGNRIKTGTDYYTPILPPAMQVLKKYNYKLPHISDQKANDYLHLVEDKLEMRKKMTFHIGRHSFATMILSHGIPIEQLARMMGHKDIRVTQVYAKILHSTIEKTSEEIAKELM